MSDKIQSFDKVVEEFGVGSVKELTPSQLSCIKRACDGFRNYLYDNCMSHSLYRGRFTGEKGNISVVIFGADLEGNVQELQLVVNTDTMELGVRGIDIPHHEVVAEKLYDLIVQLMKYVPVEVGMIDILFEGDFKEGVITGYKYEKGTCLIVIKDSLDMSYYAG